jgi:adenylate cyclase
MTCVTTPLWIQKIVQRYPAWPGVLKGGLVVIGMACAVSGGVLGANRLGLLQAAELRAYDWMYRQTVDGGADSRIVTVNLTEEDIRLQQRATLSDEAIAQLLRNLDQHNPAVIGLDLYRDVPQEPGHAELLEVLASTETVVITKLGTSDADTIPAPAVPSEQVSFNDLPVDADGVVRRALLFASVQDNTFYAFSLRLALRYLEQYDIYPQASAANPNHLHLGAVPLVPLTATTGAYQRLDAAGYQILLNYRTRHISPRLTVTQVLNEDFDPSLVQGKIVLIGNASPSGKDFFQTPYSAGESTDHLMTGVDVHAQITSQLVSVALGEQSLLWVTPNWMEALWILGWACLGGTIAWGVRHPLKLGLLIPAASLLAVAASLGLFYLQGWVPMVTPVLALLVTGGGVVIQRAYTAQQQQQMVMALLGQSTSPQIAQALWQHRDRLIQGGKLPGQRLTASILFIDIAGFSTIAEAMPPEDLMLWLNEFLEAMTLTVQEHRGIVNKFTGDGLLALFGVPLGAASVAEIQANAQNAVAAALAMGDRLQQLHQSWQQRQRPTPAMRVGIFTGDVVVGSLGGKERLEYGVIGDGVNIASRLESCHKEIQGPICRVLISDETLRYVQDLVAVKSWGAIALKGKQVALNVYQVLGYTPGTCGVDQSAEPSLVSLTEPPENRLLPPSPPSESSTLYQNFKNTRKQIVPE